MRGAVNNEFDGAEAQVVTIFSTNPERSQMS
jgi:hypothetical protein